MESIQGLVEHIVYHNDTNGYTVFSLMCQGEEIVCVGNVTSLDEGEYLKAEGEYTEHQVYGRQFKVTSMSVEVPEDEYSIERYLGSGAIRGVGPSLAARIVKKFKKDSFRIIEEEPERLAEIKGISERKAREIYQQFHEKQDMRQAMMFLAKYGITTTLSLRIYKQYGEEMYRIIQENPYRLADDMNGIGFKLADEIAKKAGIGSHSDFRIRSGIIYMLQQGTLSGHIYIPAALLVEKTAQMLGVEEEAVDHLLQSLQMDRKIVVKKIDDVSVVYGASLYRLELETAGLLKNLGVDYSVDEKEVGKVLDRIEKREALIWMTTSVKRCILLQAMGCLSSPAVPVPVKPRRLMPLSNTWNMKGWRCVWRRRREERPNVCQKPQDGRPRPFTGCWNYQADRMTTACEHSLSAIRTIPWKRMWSLLMRCPWWISI